MNTDKLNSLRAQLQTSDDFRAVMDQFHRDLSADPAFLAAGEFTEPGLLGQVLAEVARKLLGRSARIDQLKLIRLRDHPFVHGFLVMAGRLGNVIHFEDAQVGLVCVADAHGKVDYLRFHTFAMFRDDPRAGGPFAVHERPPQARMRRGRKPHRPANAASRPPDPDPVEDGDLDADSPARRG